MNMDKASILIIDDDPGVRMCLNEILEFKGYATYVAANGMEGCAMLGEHPVNLVLVDLGLPDISGMDVLNRIKTEYPMVEAIILTGNATLDSAIEATNKGAFSYIVKPYDVEQLLLHIRHAVDRQQARLELARKHEELTLNSEALAKAYAELKATQVQLLQKEKMASIGQLAAGVAHEINNPIGFIMGNLGALKKYVERLTNLVQLQSDMLKSLQTAESLELVAELEKQQRLIKFDYIVKDAVQLIDESREGAERVKRIVQDLKTFSRIEAVESKPVDINECLEATINIIWNEVKYKAEIKKDYGAIEPTICNPGQMGQIFMNLLINAAQAIPVFGEIGLKTWQADGSIYVSISDNGCGIPAEIQTRIYEPFFTTKDVGNGTGLGLSIVYDILKKHAGDISLESEPGKGTTFTVMIPVCR